MYCKLNCRLDALTPQDDIVKVITIVNFIFGFFILVPFVNIWLELSKILEGLVELTTNFEIETRNLFSLDTNEDFINLKVEDIKKWDMKLTHLQKLVHSKSEYVKNIYLFAIGMTKSFSIIFSMIALFVNLSISSEPIRIAFLVFCLEFAVLRYVILPASIISSTMQNLVYWVLERQKKYVKFVILHEKSRIKYDPKENIRVRLLYDYWEKIMSHWYNIASVDKIGFRLQFRYVATDWWVSKSLMNTWIESFLVTVVPSTITLFIKQITALSK